MSVKLRTVPALLLVGLAAAGCAHPVTAGPGRTVSVALQEYRLNPASIHARPGTLTLVVTNAGRLAHNLVISRAGVAQGAMRSIGPGQSGELTVTLTPGTYLLGSTLLNDEALGLYGHVTVSG